MFCGKCGAQIDDQAVVCPQCGVPTSNDQQQNSNQTQEPVKAVSEKCCPKCGSNNITFQREQTGEIGGSTHNFKGKKKHGLMWWLCVGSWIWVVKLFALPFKLLFGSKGKSVKGRTLSASKTINRTVAICQNCGNSWKVK